MHTVVSNFVWICLMWYVIVAEVVAWWSCPVALPAALEGNPSLQVCPFVPGINSTCCQLVCVRISVFSAGKPFWLRSFPSLVKRGRTSQSQPRRLSSGCSTSMFSCSQSACTNLSKQHKIDSLDFASAWHIWQGMFLLSISLEATQPLTTLLSKVMSKGKHHLSHCAPQNTIYLIASIL